MSAGPVPDNYLFAGTSSLAEELDSALQGMRAGMGLEAWTLGSWRERQCRCAPGEERGASSMALTSPLS